MQILFHAFKSSVLFYEDLVKQSAIFCQKHFPKQTNDDAFPPVFQSLCNMV